MRITRGEYGRVRVVYVNPGDLKRSFSRKEWEAYEVGLKLPIYWAFPEGGPWQRMMVWAKGALNQKMREKRKTLLKTAPSAAYTGYLWRHTIHELRQQFADRSRKLTVNVIGSESSDALMELLVQKSPVGGDKPLRIFSPYASVEPDILLGKLAEKTDNPGPDKFGSRKPDASPDDKTKEFSKPWFTRWEAGTIPEEQAGLNRISFDDGAGRMAFHHYPPVTSEQIEAYDAKKKGIGRGKSGHLPPDNGTGSAELVRMTLGDDALARTLVAELRNRNVDLTDPRKRIVLISESDTFYGNAFPDSFRKQVIEQARIDGERKKPDDGKQWELIDVRRFSYLGGLDGVTALAPGAAKTARQEKHGDDEDGLQELAKAMGMGTVPLGKPEPGWRPEGSQQYDRVRALAGTLVRRFRGGADEVVAVGVVGNDPYDKLVILQALRPLLPGVIFFTTDLDSNLLTEENLRHTRNLLVASSYGLRLHPEVHGSTMPFRDSYQTAVYHSTLASLRAYGKHKLWRENYDGLVSFKPHKLETVSSLFPGGEAAPRRNIGMFRDLVAMETQGISVTRAGWQPNLYEIGSKGAVSLLPSGERVAVRANSDPPPRLFAWTLFLALGFLAVCYILVVAFSCRPRRSGATPLYESREAACEPGRKRPLLRRAGRCSLGGSLLDRCGGSAPGVSSVCQHAGHSGLRAAATGLAQGQLLDPDHLRVFRNVSYRRGCKIPS